MTDASEIITCSRIASTPVAGFDTLVATGPTRRSTLPFASSRFAVIRSESADR